jgi:uncharacterized membrane-anchored protein
MTRGTVVVLAWVCLGAGVAAAETTTADPKTPAEADATAEPGLPHVEGPRLVELGSSLELDLPAGFSLLERAEARAVLEKMGNEAANVLGIVFQPDKDWIVVIEYDDVGYVSDSDADELDADELLESYRRGTEQQNARRAQLGVPALVIDGWSEQPHYERAGRRLAWGLKAHSDGQVINFFTKILGRRGYLSMNLIDNPAAIEQSKQQVAPLLTAVRFKPGERYEDYREGDHSSGMGLRMLVLGGAGIAAAKAAKTGILVAILLALKKGFVVIGVAIAGFFKWLFGRKRDREPVVAEAAPPDASSD